MTDIGEQLQSEMARQGITKSELARRLKSSRSQVDRILDADAANVTIETLFRVARCLGKTINVTIEQRK